MTDRGGSVSDPDGFGFFADPDPDFKYPDPSVFLLLFTQNVPTNEIFLNLCSIYFATYIRFFNKLMSTGTGDEV